MRGCGCLFLFSRSKKKGLAEAKTTLWASICVPSSHARVTSTKSPSFLRSPKDELTIFWNSFHCKHNFSEFVIVILGLFVLMICWATDNNFGFVIQGRGKLYRRLNLKWSTNTVSRKQELNRELTSRWRFWSRSRGVWTGTRFQTQRGEKRFVL